MGSGDCSWVAGTVLGYRVRFLGSGYGFRAAGRFLGSRGGFRAAGAIFGQQGRFLGSRGGFRAAGAIFGQQGRFSGSRRDFSGRRGGHTLPLPGTTKNEFLNHILLILFSLIHRKRLWTSFFLFLVWPNRKNT